MAGFSYEDASAPPPPASGGFGYDEAVPPEARPKSGLIRRGIGDTALSFGQGAVGAVKAITDVTGAGTRVSKGLGDLSEGMQGLLSPERQAEMAARQAKVSEADKSGSAFDQVTSRLGGFVEAPVQTLAQGIGSIVPTVAAAVATRGKTLPALAVGGAMGVGGVKGQNYDTVLSEALKQGKTQAEAEALAQQASEYSAENAGQQALGGVLGAVAGTTGVERIVRGAVGAGQGVLKRVARGALAEGVPEGAQGAQQQFAQNQALNNAGFETDPMAGVLGQGVFEGTVGGAIGGVAGLPGPRGIDAPPVAPGQPAPAAPVTPGDAIRATAPPVTGPLTGSLAAGIEAAAQAADAGRPLPVTRAPLPVPQVQELTGEAAARAQREADRPAPPTGEILPDDITNNGGPFRSNLSASRALAKAGPGFELAPVTGGVVVRRKNDPVSRFAAENAGGADTLSQGMLDPGFDAQELSLEEAAALTGAPAPQPERIPAGRATELPVDTAEPTGEGLTPTTPEPRRAPRTPKPEATRDMTDADLVTAYVEQRRAEGTLAGRRFAGDFDAGRITPADVLALARPRTEATPDERLAAAAAQAPAPAGGIQLPRAEQPASGITVERTSARPREQGGAPQTLLQARRAAAKADRVKVMTRFGQNVYVDRADWESDRPRMRHFTSTGKSLGLIVRENLDPTGEGRAADVKEQAENPLFNVIGTRDGNVFASQGAAARERSMRGLVDSHDITPQGNGFVLKRKASADTQAPTAPSPAEGSSAPTKAPDGNQESLRPVRNAQDGREAVSDPQAGAVQPGGTVQGQQANADDAEKPRTLKERRANAKRAAAPAPQAPAGEAPSPAAGAGAAEPAPAVPGARAGGEVEADGVARPSGFDPEAFDRERNDRIKASRDAGNTHLDELPAYVETMRGKPVRYVHDPKVKGRILTVDNNGNVYVEWTDAYSQEKEGAVPMKYGKKTVMQTSLGPRDLKDYVVDEAPAAAPPRSAAPTTDPFADDYSALVGKTIEQTVTTDDGKTATLRMEAARALRDFDRREKALADLKACLAGKA